MGISPIGAGMAGLDRSLALLQKAAESVASPEGGDPVEAIVAMQVAKTSLEVNIAVIKTANDLQGQLVNLFA
jgi:hypothetical protein